MSTQYPASTHNVPNIADKNAPEDYKDKLKKYEGLFESDEEQDTRLTSIQQQQQPQSYFQTLHTQYQPHENQQQQQQRSQQHFVGQQQQQQNTAAQIQQQTQVKQYQSTYYNPSIQNPQQPYHHQQYQQQQKQSQYYVHLNYQNTQQQPQQQSSVHANYHNPQYHQPGQQYMPPQASSHQQQQNLLEVAQIYQQQNLQNDQHLYNQSQNQAYYQQQPTPQVQNQADPPRQQQKQQFNRFSKSTTNHQYNNSRQNPQQSHQQPQQEPDRQNKDHTSTRQNNNAQSQSSTSHQRQSFKEYQQRSNASGSQDNRRSGTNANVSSNSRSQEGRTQPQNNNNASIDRNDRRDNSRNYKESYRRSKSRSNDKDKFNKPQTTFKQNYDKNSTQLERYHSNKQPDTSSKTHQEKYHKPSTSNLQESRSVNKSDFMSASSTSRLADRLRSQLQNSKRQFERDDYDYIRQICKRAATFKSEREHQEREERRNQRKLEESQAKVQQVHGMKLNQQKSVDQRVLEAKVIAEYFYLLNETNWNKFDDVFYIMNRRWFDRWKDYISYDYIVRFLIEQGRKEPELSINKILSNNSNPGEISNAILLMEKKDFLGNRSQAPERNHYLNAPLKNGLIPEKDFFLVSENIWRFLSQRYKGEEIKRYAIYKNQAGILERQPYLPMLQVCLVLRDEAIRNPKWMILPRKTTFEQAKWIIKDVFNWLKDYLDDEIRLWRLHPELRDLDFIEQYNQQLSQKVLPKVMKFPGFSLEKSLKFYIEEYQTFDRFRETLFVEVRKVNTISLFELDFKDNRTFDEGAFNLDSHLNIYSMQNFNEQWQTSYNVYYKFQNNTQKDYWDISYTQGDIYDQFKRQILPDEVSQKQLSLNKSSPKSIKSQEANVSKTQKKNSAERTGSQIQQPKSKQETKLGVANKPVKQVTKKKQSSTALGSTSIPVDIKQQSNSANVLVVDKSIKQKCGSCSKIDFQYLMYTCPNCNSAYYCNLDCSRRDQRFHQSDCEEIQRKKVEQDFLNIQNENNTIDLNPPTGTSLSQNLQQTSQSNTVDVVSDKENQSSSSDESFSSSSDSDAFSSSDEDEKQRKKQAKKQKYQQKQKKQKKTIIEIDKSKLIEEKKSSKAKEGSVLKFDDSNLPQPVKSEQTTKTSDTQSILQYIGKRKKSNQSLDSAESENLTNAKRMKSEASSNTGIIPFESIQKTQKYQDKSIATTIQSSDSIPFKLETYKEKPFLKPRNTETQDEPGAKLGSLLTILTQLYDLKDSLTIEQGPLNAIILDVLTRLLDQSQIQTNFMLPFNKLERHLDLKQDIVGIFNTMINKLAAQNQSLLQSFAIKQKFSQICINCGDKQSKEFDQYALELDNLADDNMSKFSVKLKIIYIFDQDKYKKYEIQLKPGEYSFADVTTKIREKIQIDHPQLKLGKKTFILIDLHYDYTMFGQMISNENMKFNFKQDQSLTTFAYEISKTQKEKIKKLHFVHIAKADQDSRIIYQTFPRLIMYSETDQVKNVSLKVFKGLRTTLSSTLYQTDPLFMQQSEQEAYNQLFIPNGIGSSEATSTTISTEPYEMVLVMQDGSRWKLDPNQKQKLNQIVDVDMIVRFEVIFPVITSFVELKQDFKKEFEKVISPEREPGMRELQLCIRKYIRQCIVGGDQMPNSCEVCKEQKGAQQVKELIKLGQNLILKINKIDKNQLMEYPLRISLDKFISKSSTHASGNDYDFVGGISFEDFNIIPTKTESNSENINNRKNDTYSTILYNSKDNIWYRFSFGNEPQSVTYEAIVVDDKEGQNRILLDKSMDIIIYKKTKKDDNKQLFKKF